MGWVGVDFDATLATYTTGDGVEGTGAPIQPVVDHVRDLLSKGKEVRILTARVSTAGKNDVERQQEMIGDWTEAVFGQRLQAKTCEKDWQMEYLLDDRAVQVEKNTGQLSVDKAWNDALAEAASLADGFGGGEDLAEEIRKLSR